MCPPLGHILVKKSELKSKSSALFCWLVGARSELTAIVALRAGMVRADARPLAVSKASALAIRGLLQKLPSKPFHPSAMMILPLASFLVLVFEDCNVLRQLNATGSSCNGRS